MNITFKSYTKATNQEVTLILNERNRPEIRNNMVSNDVIPLNEHTKWINTLKSNDTCKYYLAYFDNTPVASICYTNITDKSSVFGMYSFSNGTGNGALLEFLLIEHFFNDLKLQNLIAKVFDYNSKIFKMHTTRFGFVDCPDYDDQLKDGRILKGAYLNKELWGEKRDSVSKLIQSVYKIDSVVWED